MHEMVDYVFFLEEPGPTKPTKRKENGLSQVREGSPRKIDYSLLAERPAFPTVIPPVAAFTSRHAQSEYRNPEHKQRQPANKPRSLQTVVYDGLRTAVGWWKDPSELYRSMAETFSFGLPIKQQKALPATSSIAQSNHRASLLEGVFGGKSASIQPVLRESIETPVDARQRARIIAARAQVMEGSTMRSPIRSEIESDSGLGVILTDQFVPLAYVFS